MSSRASGPSLPPLTLGAPEVRDWYLNSKKGSGTLSPCIGDYGMSNADRPKPIVPDSATFGKHLPPIGRPSQRLAQQRGVCRAMFCGKVCWDLWTDSSSGGGASKMD